MQRECGRELEGKMQPHQQKWAGMKHPDYSSGRNFKNGTHKEGIKLAIERGREMLGKMKLMSFLAFLLRNHWKGRGRLKGLPEASRGLTAGWKCHERATGRGQVLDGSWNNFQDMTGSCLGDSREEHPWERCVVHSCGAISIPDFKSSTGKCHEPSDTALEYTPLGASSLDPFWRLSEPVGFRGFTETWCYTHICLTNLQKQNQEKEKSSCRGLPEKVWELKTWLALKSSWRALPSKKILLEDKKN